MPEPKDEQPTQSEDVASSADQEAQEQPRFFYPEHMITISARSRKEADAKLKKAVKAREAKEEE